MELATQNAFNPPATMYAVESASSAVAAQAKAMVEARYTIAMYRRRDWDQVRQDLVKECRRPLFANNKSAYYRKPIGNGVEGLGIRFVEVALRCMTNVLIETSMIFEDEQKEVHRVSVTDLEANVTYPLDVKVSKTVERSKPADDGSYISVRKNSYNKNAYTVPAQDDDLLNKRAALISKAIRTLGLRIIPGDLCDEAEGIIKAIRLDEAAKDPNAERKRLVDAFGDIGVQATQLAEYLGHDIGSCSPPELVDLRGLYGAIKDGEATWVTVMENKAAQPASGTPAAGAAPAAPTARPTMSQATFDKKLDGWTKMIEAGKPPAEIISMVETRTLLSDAQKASINGVKPAAKPDAKAESTDSDGVITVSYAHVADRMAKAADMDKLAEAARLIGAVQDAKQRDELSAMYERRGAELVN